MELPLLPSFLRDTKQNDVKWENFLTTPITPLPSNPTPMDMGPTIKVNTPPAQLLPEPPDWLKKMALDNKTQINPTQLPEPPAWLKDTAQDNVPTDQVPTPPIKATYQEEVAPQFQPDYQANLNRQAADEKRQAAIQDFQNQKKQFQDEFASKVRTLPPEEVAPQFQPSPTESQDWQKIYNHPGNIATPVEAFGDGFVRGATFNVLNTVNPIRYTYADPMTKLSQGAGTLAGGLAGLMGLDEIMGATGVTGAITKAVSNTIGNNIKAAKFLADMAHDSALFGTQSFIGEGVNQIQNQQFNPKKLAGATASGLLMGPIFKGAQLLPGGRLGAAAGTGLASFLMDLYHTHDPVQSAINGLTMGAFQVLGRPMPKELQTQTFKDTVKAISDIYLKKGEANINGQKSPVLNRADADRLANYKLDLDLQFFAKEPPKKFSLTPDQNTPRVPPPKDMTSGQQLELGVPGRVKGFGQGEKGAQELPLAPLKTDGLPEHNDNLIIRAEADALKILQDHGIIDDSTIANLVNDKQNDGHNVRMLTQNAIKNNLSPETLAEQINSLVKERGLAKPEPTPATLPLPTSPTFNYSAEFKGELPVKDIALRPDLFQLSRTGELKSGLLNRNGAELKRVEAYTKQGGFDWNKFEPVELAVFDKPIPENGIEAGKPYLLSGHNRYQMLENNKTAGIPPGKYVIKHYPDLKSAVIDSIKSNIEKKVTTYDYNLVQLLREGILKPEELPYILGGDAKRSKQIETINSLFSQFTPDAWDNTISRLTLLKDKGERFLQRKMSAFESLGDTINQKPFFMQDGFLKDGVRKLLGEISAASSDKSLGSIEARLKSLKDMKDSAQAIKEQQNLFGQTEFVRVAKDTERTYQVWKNQLTKLAAALERLGYKDKAAQYQKAIAVLKRDGPNVDLKLREIKQTRENDPNVVVGKILDTLLETPVENAYIPPKPEGISVPPPGTVKTSKLPNFSPPSGVKYNLEGGAPSLDSVIAHVKANPKMTFKNLTPVTKAVQQIIHNRGLSEIEKTTLANFVFRDKRGIASSHFLDALNKPEQPQYSFDMDHGRIPNAVNPEGMDKLKGIMFDRMVAEARKQGLQLDTISTPTGDEIYSLGSREKDSKFFHWFNNQYLKTEFTPDKVPEMTMPIENMDVLKQAILEKHGTIQPDGTVTGMKVGLKINTDGTATVSDISISGGWGKNSEEAAAALKRAKASGVKGTIGTFGKDVFNPRLAFRKEKPEDDFINQQSSTYSVDQLSQMAKSLPDVFTPERMKLIDNPAVKDQKAALIESKVIDDTTTLENADYWNAAGLNNQPHFLIDLPCTKLLNKFPKHANGKGEIIEAGPEGTDRKLTNIARKIRDTIQDDGGEFNDYRESDPAKRSKNIFQNKSGVVENPGQMRGTVPETGAQSDLGKSATRRDEAGTGKNNGSTHSGDISAVSSSANDRRSTDKGGKTDQSKGLQAGISGSSELKNTPLFDKADFARLMAGKFGLHFKPEFLAKYDINTENLNTFLQQVSRTEINEKIPATIKLTPEQIFKLRSINNIIEDPKAVNIFKLYGLDPEAVDLAKSYKAMVYVDSAGNLTFGGMPMEFGYGTSAPIARANKNVNKGPIFDKNAALNKMTEKQLGEGVQNFLLLDSKMKGPAVQSYMDPLPDPEKAIILQNTMLQDETTRDNYIAKAFNYNKQSTERLIREMPEEENAFKTLNEKAWSEQYRSEHEKMPPEDKAKPPEEMKTDLVKSMDNLLGSLKEPVPPRWTDSHEGWELFNNWQGAIALTKAKTASLRLKLQDDIIAGIQNLFRDPTTPPAIKNGWNKFHGIFGKTAIADMAISAYRDTTRMPFGNDAYRRNWENMPKTAQVVSFLSRHLTPEMMDVVKQIDDAYLEIGKRAQMAGLIDNLLENYQSRTYIGKRKWSEYITGFKTGTIHGKGRKLESMFDIYSNDGELALNGATMELESYINDVMEALYNRQFLKLGVTMHDPETLKPVFMTGDEGAIPEGYQKIKVSNFKIYKDGENKSVFAPARIATHLNRILDTAHVQHIPVVRQILQFAKWSKQNILFESLFHYYNLTAGYMFGTDFPLKYVNPVVAAKFGQELIRSMDPVLQMGIMNGLEIGRPVNANIEAYLMEARGLKLNEIAKFKRSTKLFQVYGDGLKTASFFFHYNKRLKEEMKKADNGLPAEEIARQCADLANADFGGLNYKRMGWSKDMMDLWSLVLFAPDWQIGNISTYIKAIANSDKHGYTKWFGSESKEFRRFWGNTFLRTLILSQILNLAINGKTTFENDKWKEKKDISNLFEVDLTKVQEFISGKKMQQKFYFNIGAWIFEGFALLADPIRFAKNKASVPVRMAADLLKGSDYMGRPFTDINELIKTGKYIKHSPYDKPNDSFWGNAPSMIAYEAKQVLPIPVQTVLSFLDGSMTVLEVLGNLSGMRVKRYYPQKTEPTPQDVQKYMNYMKNTPNRMLQDAKRKAMEGPQQKSWFDALMNFQNQKDYQREQNRKQTEKKMKEMMKK